MFGAVSRVILRGEVVYVDGQVLVKPGYGLNTAEMPTQKSAKDLTKPKHTNFSDIDSSTKLIGGNLNGMNAGCASLAITSTANNVGSIFSFNKATTNDANPSDGLMLMVPPTHAKGAPLLLTTDMTLNAPTTEHGTNGCENKRRVRQISSTYLNGGFILFKGIKNINYKFS